MQKTFIILFSFCLIGLAGYYTLFAKKVNIKQSDSNHMLSIVKETPDIRGNLLWLDFNSRQYNLVEIKKGFSRGGHFHPFDSIHIVVSGLVSYKEVNPSDLSSEKEVIMAPFSQVVTRAGMAHIFTAQEDSMFLESFDGRYSSTEYEPYRKVIRDQLQTQQYYIDK